MNTEVSYQRCRSAPIDTQRSSSQAEGKWQLVLLSRR